MEKKGFIHHSEVRKDSREDQTTGLPWPITWRGVYLLVLGSFLLWVGLLFALSVSFR